MKDAQQKSKRIELWESQQLINISLQNILQ